jgi:2-polyprenyl-3-methyl-5-hydroxy-6-metoxy-1,4-benzoquinol methylase
MHSLSSRYRQRELMDEPGLASLEHERALDGLRRVNRLSGSSGLLWRAMRGLAEERRGAGLRVLDVASGGGDVALGVARRAARAGIELTIDGCDISPTAVDHAQRQAALGGCGHLRFFQLDVLRDPLPEGYEIVICSLFLHHLSDDEAVGLLGNMSAAARVLVLVDDLRRSRLGYALAWLGCRLLTRSRIVHVDGPRSVAAAFTSAEALRLAQTAGLTGATISHHWPQRFLMRWRRA